MSSARLTPYLFLLTWLCLISGQALAISETKSKADTPREGDKPQVVSDIIEAKEDPAVMQRAFDALSEGGSVTMPLQDTFWGARFGTLTDAFGIRWMFNCEKKAG